MQDIASDSDDSNVLNFLKKLQARAVESRCPQATVTSLLAVLRSHSCLLSLTLSARTLLQTPNRILNVKELAGGKFYYFGLEAGLRQTLLGCEHLPAELSLSFNIDGLPLAKSSRDQFWIILGRIGNFEDCEAFVVSVFLGNTKPQYANEFLQCFVEKSKVSKVWWKAFLLMPVEDRDQETNPRTLEEHHAANPGDSGADPEDPTRTSTRPGPGSTSAGRPTEHTATWRPARTAEPEPPGPSDFNHNDRQR
ncbi:hypothetical protein HPB49_009753 [Dermacentor silvarum]|uniref:Uncharacterized protein n=1 Tax=Dermacentor silvarum TaxID=543639 RepID=A0ACB8DZ37_DERSI|nr:hypothetical protein HPB49_009753 [Dermacentor silvarum]